MIKNSTNYYIGRKIILRRKFLGLEREDLAKIADIDAYQLERFEEGFDYPDPDNLLKIATALKTETGYFFID